MNDNVTYIPGRIKSAAKNDPYIAGVEDIEGLGNKEYNPIDFSGLGRKTLELKGDNNILYQEDFDSSNTIYVITYDFVLGETITIPEGCVLQFDGGSISNQNDNKFRLISKSTILNGQNKYSDVLSGCFYNTNHNILDSQSYILSPDAGVDYVFTQREAVNESGNRYVQGIIHSGEHIYVLMSQNETSTSYVVRFDKYLNKEGYFKLDVENNHGGLGFYKNGHIYITSNSTDRQIIDYDESSWATAATGSIVNGRFIDIPLSTEGSIYLMGYDDKRDEIIVVSTSSIALIDGNFNVIFERSNPDIPSDGAHYVIQGVIWEDGVATIIYSDRGNFETPHIIYYDPYNDIRTERVLIKQDYSEIEFEGCCKYPGIDNTYIICGNLPELNGYVIGKYSNKVKVDTADKLVGVTEGSFMWVYVDNAATQKLPLGSETYPYKNLTSAYILAKNKIVHCRIRPSNENYMVDFTVRKECYFVGIGDNTKPTIDGELYVLEGTMMHISNVNVIATGVYQSNWSVVQSNKGSFVNIENCVIDANHVTQCCISADNGTIHIKGTTLKNATTHAVYATYGKVYLEESNSIANTPTGIDLEYYGEVLNGRLYNLSFSDVQTTLFTSFNAIPVKLNCGTETEVNAAISFLSSSIITSPSSLVVALLKDMEGFNKGMHMWAKDTLINYDGNSIVQETTSDTRAAIQTARTAMEIYFPYGDCTFDVDSKRPTWWNGNIWTDANGVDIRTKTCGRTEERPTSGASVAVGFCYFDIDLGKPIYVKAVNGNVITWVDASGQELNI